MGDGSATDFVIDSRLHPFDPGGFHLTNIMLHIAAVILFFYDKARLIAGGCGSLQPAIHHILFGHQLRTNTQQC
jgi:hypothetical protein